MLFNSCFVVVVMNKAEALVSLEAMRGVLEDLTGEAADVADAFSILADLKNFVQSLVE